MTPNPGLQEAMLRLVSAERAGKASLTGGNNLRMSLLELVVAAGEVRHAYLRLLGGDVDDLKTQPISKRGE